jgi:hypothetical protein
MKRVLKLIPAVLMSLVLLPKVYAGNPERAGEAGASELLINPWARSSGWAGANSGAVRGIESMFLNVAGTAFVKKTEVVFANTNLLSGNDIKINTLGICQKVGQSGAIGLSVASMSFGDIEVTTTNQPEGGLGTYSPQFINVALSYAKVFSNSIYGGIAVKIISESIADVKAQGVAFDAGIQYVTGFNEAKDNLKLGISIKNVGSPMKFSGDGLSFKTAIPSSTQGGTYTVENRSSKFELPSLFNIGVAYDIKLAEIHRLTPAANFTSNSFTNDQFMFGLEYAFKNYFMVRGGYSYEEDDENLETRASWFSGPSFGFSAELPLGKGGKVFGIDYSYRVTDPFDGAHTIGGRLTL